MGSVLKKRIMRFVGSCALRDGGFTLVSVMVASALLAVVFFTSLPALVFVLRASHGNNLRTVANFTAEPTLEELRALGKAALLTRPLPADPPSAPTALTSSPPRVRAR